MSNAKRRHRRRRRRACRAVFEFMGRRWSAIWHEDGHVQMVPGYYDRWLPPRALLNLPVTPEQ